MTPERTLAKAPSQKQQRETIQRVTPERTLAKAPSQKQRRETIQRVTPERTLARGQIKTLFLAVTYQTHWWMGESVGFRSLGSPQIIRNFVLSVAAVLGPIVCSPQNKINIHLLVNSITVFMLIKRKI